MNKTFKSKLSIEASAGSGKTYQLAKRYIQLLSAYIANIKFNQKRNSCKIYKQNSVSLKPPESIGSIVAITFTNKAAAEMKERIILFLKKLSGVYKDDSFEKSEFPIKNNEALRLLIEIIKNHAEFNVTTIDSFMNKILKAFAIDLNIYPDYDITFNRDEIFQLSVDDIILDDKNCDILIKFLKELLYLDNKGLDGASIIKKGIDKFKDMDFPDDFITFEYLKSQFNLRGNNLKEIKTEIGDNIKSDISNIASIIKKNDDCFNKNRIKKFIDVDFDKFLKDFSANTEIVKNKTINHLLKKNKTINSEDINGFIQSLKNINDYIVIYILLKSVKDTEIVTNVLKLFKERESYIKSQLNIVDGSLIAKSVSNILNEDNGVSYAFCKLGERLSHYLIDEFQDTSNTQFQAIYPLIDNAVAEGGSLFIVGDKKQAIYAWRGGDYKIFNKILTEIKDIKKENIKNNYRSNRNIVEFNNTIFNVSNLLNDDLRNFFDKNYDNVFNCKLIDAITEIYEHSYQDTISEKDGYVEIELKRIDRYFNEDLTKDEFYFQKITETLNNLFQKGVRYSDIMILIRKKQDIDKVVNLLRENNIPFVSEDSLIITNNYEIRKLLLVVSAMVFPNDASYLNAMDEIGINPLIIEEIKDDIKFLTPYEIFAKALSLNIFNVKDNRIYFYRFFEEVLALNSKQYSIEDMLSYFYENKEIAVAVEDDLDAVKIMTIHKSKGLESSTVIIPFYDWKLYDSKNVEIYDTFDIKEITDKDEQIFAKVTENLRALLPAASEKYFEQLKTNFIEALNLIYVANTRAKENLFIFGSYELNKKEEFFKNIDVASLLVLILKNSYFKDKPIEFPLKLGKLEINPTTAWQEESIDETYNCQMSHSFRNFLKVYPENYYLDLSPVEKLLGDFFHTAMSFIGIINSNDNIDEIAKDACMRAGKVINFFDKEVQKIIIQTVKDLRHCFYDIDKCRTEKEIINKKGEIFRIDRIVKKGCDYFIIDYKTGNEESKHIKQIKNYMNLINNSKGIIYYTKTRKIINVD